MSSPLEPSERYCPYRKQFPNGIHAVFDAVIELLQNVLVLGVKAALAFGGEGLSPFQLSIC